MASSLPPVKGAAFTFDISLVSQAAPNIFKTSVTLAAGDITVSKDGGAFSNITTLPTEISTSGVLPVALSATEMNADRVTVRFHDAAGDEWQDALVVIYTAAQTLDTTDGVADAIKAKTDNLPASPAAVGSAMTLAANQDVRNVTGNVTGSVGSVTAAVTAGTVSDKTGYALTAAYDAAKTAATQVSVDDVPNNAEFNARTLPAADYTIVSDLPSVPSTADIKTTLEADGSKLDHLWEMTEDDGGVRRLTANALEQAPATSIVAQDVADALKLAPTAGAPAAGSVYAELAAIDSMVGAGVPTLYAPTAATRVVGDNDGGSVASLAAHDDVSMSTGEVAGTGLEVTVTVGTTTPTEVPSLVRITGYYDGSASHSVGVYLYNYSLAAWELAATMLNRSTPFDYVIPAHADHADPLTGAMSLRFLHSAGTYQAAHALHLDWVSFEKVETTSQLQSDVAAVLALAQGFTTTLPDAVWDEAIAGHLTAGSTGATLNGAGGAADPLLNAVPGAYAAGTAGHVLGSLTAGVVLTIPAPVQGSTITALIAASLTATLTGLTISADWAKLYLTVKQNTSDADAASILQVVVSNPAAALTDGALYVQKAAASAAQRTQAALTVTQATGTLVIALDEALTGALREGYGAVYDLKELTTGGAANVLALGTWNMAYTPTWAVA